MLGSFITDVALPAPNGTRHNPRVPFQSDVTHRLSSSAAIARALKLLVLAANDLNADCTPVARFTRRTVAPTVKYKNPSGANTSPFA